MAKNWAIAIGINEYENLPTLKYAVRDAELMKDWFEKEAKFEKVYLFSDNSPPIEDGSRPYKSQPNRDTLLRFFRTRFNRPFLEPGDNLWFFFSGHGMRHADRDYLMPSGVDPHPEAIENSAIALSDITERLRRCGADNVVLLLDACRDETGSRGGGVGAEKQQGVITMASCSPTERSYEIKELGQGSFTYCLLQGLRIQGEGNCATVERLYRYLQYQVPEINRNYQKPRQTPYAIAEPASKYHLILLPDYIQPTLEDVATLREDALEAEAENNLQLAETLWHRLVKFDQEKALIALRRIWRKMEHSAMPPLQNDREIAGKKATRERNRESSSRSGTVISPPRVTKTTSVNSTTSTPSNFTRRNLLKIAGFTGAGIGATVLARSGLQWVSDNSSDPSQNNQSQNNQPQKSDSSSSTDTESIELFPSNFEVITVNDRGQEIKREPGEAAYFPEKLSKDVTLEMVSIPGGKFLMGTEDEEIERLVKKFDWEGFRSEQPQHEVTIQPFFMGKFPITQAQWQAVMGNNPAKFQDNPLNPVEKVSWDDAQEFCVRLSKKTGREYRLPTEAEWEYACRAETTTPFNFGATITGELANYNATKIYAGEAPGKYQEKTTPVGSFPPNRFGLYDMHGNVWEWCEDDWHDNYQSAPTDGSVWRSGSSNLKVVRGGSWGDIPGNCRSAFRLYNTRAYRLNSLGFRVVCVAPRTT